MDSDEGSAVGKWLHTFERPSAASAWCEFMPADAVRVAKLEAEALENGERHLPIALKSVVAAP